MAARKRPRRRKLRTCNIRETGLSAGYLLTPCNAFGHGDEQGGCDDGDDEAEDVRFEDVAGADEAGDGAADE